MSLASSEELHAVAVVGQVARRDHDGAVRLRLVEEDGHEHRGRRGEAAVERLGAAREQGGEYGAFQALGRNA